MRFITSVICAAVLAGIASGKLAKSSTACLNDIESAELAAPAKVERRDCSAEIAAYNLARRAKRGDVKRSFYPTMPNEICVLSPEVAREDWVPLSSSLVRQDVTEGQPGVPFTLDIGVLDVTTCQPVSGAMVEIWSPNQVGDYGQTFLRGAFQSEDNGIAEFQTIFPGYTSDGANHINVAVHVGDSTSQSTITHNGQVFFTDPWTNIIGQSAGYNKNTHSRVMNAQDPSYVAANSNGYTAVVDIEEIQDDWPAGILGYITVGINPNHLVQ
ncbi:aromatic compound dioxygenase [Dendrothele bispora CBS 962.96]|uniref:Aromatic compound dioxygenase n=1 Tax=Dendrothele bispora (strain CBS 962.96) TaxID=1314807 RepID=A0A4S8L6C4_DENBC|nr:aromatic compound dioxygenase [Dendrothele bispora CBS 962.96]